MIFHVFFETPVRMPRFKTTGSHVVFGNHLRLTEKKKNKNTQFHTSEGVYSRDRSVVYSSSDFSKSLTKIWLFIMPEQPSKFSVKNLVLKILSCREYSVDRVHPKLSSPYLHISIFV